MGHLSEGDALDLYGGNKTDAHLCGGNLVITSEVCYCEQTILMYNGWHACILQQPREQLL